MGPTPVAVATASAGRSAAHASLVTRGASLPRQPQAHLGETSAVVPVFRYAPDRRRASAELARDADATATASSTCCGRGAGGAWEESEGSDWRSDPIDAAANLTVDLGELTLTPSLTLTLILPLTLPYTPAPHPSQVDLGERLWLGGVWLE